MPVDLSSSLGPSADRVLLFDGGVSSLSSSLWPKRDEDRRSKDDGPGGNKLGWIVGLSLPPFFPPKESTGRPGSLTPHLSSYLFGEVKTTPPRVFWKSYGRWGWGSVYPPQHPHPCLPRSLYRRQISCPSSTVPESPKPR